MFTEERDRWDVLLGVLVATMAIGGLYLLSRDPPQEEHSQAAVTTATAHSDSRIEASQASAQSAVEPTIGSVYECNRSGQKILSDRPCGPDASVRQIAEPNRMDAQDTSQLYRPVYGISGRRSGSGSASGSSDVSARCDSIQQRIEAINARMRHRYTSQQGQRFREELRDLSRERYEARCIR
jgi:hypothetical protein